MCKVTQICSKTKGNYTTDKITDNNSYHIVLFLRRAAVKTTESGLVCYTLFYIWVLQAHNRWSIAHTSSIE